MRPYEDEGDLAFLWLAGEGIIAPLPLGWAEYKLPDGQACGKTTQGHNYIRP